MPFFNDLLTRREQLPRRHETKLPVTRLREANYPDSFSLSNLLTCFGLALPLEAFIT